MNADPQPSAAEETAVSGYLDTVLATCDATNQIASMTAIDHPVRSVLLFRNSTPDITLVRVLHGLDDTGCQMSQMSLHCSASPHGAAYRKPGDTTPCPSYSRTRPNYTLQPGVATHSFMLLSVPFLSAHKHSQQPLDIFACHTPAQHQQAGTTCRYDPCAHRLCSVTSQRAKKGNHDGNLPFNEVTIPHTSTMRSRDHAHTLNFISSATQPQQLSTTPGADHFEPYESLRVCAVLPH